MTSQNWPDPKSPGVPMFPEQDGWHWLRVFGRATIEWWSADKQAFDNHYDPDYAIYECACLTPTQINEMLAAERERAATAIDQLKNEERGLYATGLMTTRAEITIRALASAADEIRNLGAAP